MFSFHRPKVYRSSTGCCICKAKSSSSRFTDSKKYEDDFLECFKLSSPRQGEICNACVLLVKRWKKLPAGSDRNWQHVVDARAGPGMKSMTKFKSKNNGTKKNDKSAADQPLLKKKKKERRYVREYSPTLSDKSDNSDDMDMEIAEANMGSARSGRSSCSASPGGSDCEVELVAVKRRRLNRRFRHPVRRAGAKRVGDFIDHDYWKRETICCGTIYRGRNNEIIVDPRLLKPCTARIEMCKRLQPAAPVQAAATSAATPVDSGASPSSKTYSDSSSDSGYDESSNQNLPEQHAYKKTAETTGSSSCIGVGDN